MTSARTVTKACLIVGLATTIGFIPAHAAVQENDTTNIALSVFVPCAAGGAGENVDLVGPLHTLITFTINGNTVSGVFHFQPQGIVGAGETTGQTYHATGITEESFKIAFQNGQANFSSINNFRIIGQGTGNNFLVHENFHMTFNAGGVLTVTHDNFSIECK